MTQNKDGAPQTRSIEDFIRAAKSPLTSARVFLMLSQMPATSIFVAQNRGTPHYILDRLSHHKDPAVFCEVAGNPSTPRATLRALYSRAVDESNIYCCGMLALNPSTPGDVLLALSRSTDARVRAHAKKNISVLERVGSASITAEHGGLSKDEFPLYVNNPDALSRWVVANLAGAPAWALGQLSMDDNDCVVLAVARNKETPLPVLEFLSHSGSALIRFAVASHNLTPPKTIDRLAFDTDPLVRRAAEHSRTLNGLDELGANNDIRPDGIGPTTPVGYLVRAARSPLTSKRTFSILSRLPRMSALVAQSRLAPDHVLDQLSRHRDPAVFCSVAENSSTPQSTLRAMYFAAMSEPSPPYAAYCCEMIASNPSTPGDLLQLLAQSDNDRIRARAEKNIETLRAVDPAVGAAEDWELPQWELELYVKSEDVLPRWAMASRVSAPSWVLNQLSTDSDEAVVLAVAGNGRTSPGVLELLSHSKNALIRFSVASHKRAAAQTLARLASDADPLIRRAVENNLNMPANLAALSTSDNLAEEAENNAPRGPL